MKTQARKITNAQVDTIREIQATIHASCLDAGWYTDLKTGEPKRRPFPEAIDLIHSEASEALEGWRKNLRDPHLPHRSNIEVELADIIIRVLDTAQHENLDVARAMQEKFAYNQIRADHKLETRTAKGGKRI